MGLGIGRARRGALGVFLCQLFFAGSAFALPCSQPAACRELVAVDGTATLPVYVTHSLSDSHPQLERAVIVVHGVLRNADEYFADTAQAAVLSGVSETTLVLAPHFQAEEDKPQAGQLFWDGGDWKRGNASLNGSHLSSYTIVDRLLLLLGDRARFPGLKEIVLTGHSAGGQLVSRYVATSRAEEGLGIGVHYVIANPSTYFYPSAYRARAGSFDRFEIPDSSTCPDYDEYPYGVVKANAYVAPIPAAQMEKSLATRHLTLLLGEADKDSDYLDMSCGANLQGPHRYLRGLTYAAYLEYFLKPSRLKVAVVPGVGHSGRDMYQSSEGRAILFQ